MLRRYLALRRYEDGFTFNEVLLAMNLIVIGVLGYSAGTGNLIRWNSASRDYTVAVNLALDKLEQIKAQKNWTDVNNCPASGDHDIAATGEPGGQYNRCWVIADSPLGAELKEITVTVSWPGRESREVTLATLIYSG
jgi:Tfp pilus assembly protein PilV